MQPAAARVGPSSEQSVRRIAVRFSSGATICIEKTIKVRFLSVVSTMDKTALPVFIARSGPTHDAMSACEESLSKQRDKKIQGAGRCAPSARYPPKFRRRLRNFGGAGVVLSTKLLLPKFSTWLIY